MTELFISDKRMLQLMEYCVENKIAGIEKNSDWCALIGISPSNLDGIKKGSRGFSKDHLLAAGEQLGVSMDFLFGLSNDMFRGRSLTPMQKLKEAVRLVELEIGAPKKSNKKSNKKV